MQFLHVFLLSIDSLVDNAPCISVVSAHSFCRTCLCSSCTCSFFSKCFPGWHGTMDQRWFLEIYHASVLANLEILPIFMNLLPDQGRFLSATAVYIYGSIMGPPRPAGSCDRTGSRGVLIVWLLPACPCSSRAFFRNLFRWSLALTVQSTARLSDSMRTLVFCI